MDTEQLVECPDGTKEWYLNGKLHRTDGPAIEHSDGTKLWYLDDKLHRTDGPVVEHPDGSKLWYLNDEEYSFNEYVKEANWTDEEIFLWKLSN